MAGSFKDDPVSQDNQHDSNLIGLTCRSQEADTNIISALSCVVHWPLLL